MRFRRRDVLTGLAVAPLATTRVQAQAAGYPQLIEGFRSHIIQQLAKTQVAGASVAIVEGSRTVWAEGFGHTDASRARPVTPDTLFSLQSISKTFTAILTLQAVDRGWFGLDDPLVLHLPRFSVRSRGNARECEKITIRHLLSHWSGLPHEAPVGNNYDLGDATFEAHVASIADVWLLAPVQSRYAYSNLGFDLLAWLLQTRSGMAFEQYAERHLLRRLGMTSTTFDRCRALASPAVARGQVAGRDVAASIPMLGAGGVYSTARDMGRFLAAQLADLSTHDGVLLTRGSLKAMRTPQFPVDHQTAGYGFGLFARQAFGTRMYSHGGGGYGYDTEHRWFPELGLGVVVLTNDGEGSGIAQDLADHISETCIRGRSGRTIPEPSSALTDRPIQKANPADLQKFVGRYRAYSGMREFALVDGALRYRVGTSDRALDYHGTGEFTAPDERFRFVLDSTGQPRTADDLGTVGVDTFVLNDRPGEPAGPDRPGWKPFLGDYAGLAYGEKVPLKIYLQNGHLYASRAGGTKLLEHAAGLFFTVWGESVEFDRLGLLYGSRRFVREPA